VVGLFLDRPMIKNSSLPGRAMSVLVPRPIGLRAGTRLVAVVGLSDQVGELGLPAAVVGLLERADPVVLRASTAISIRLGCQLASKVR
jgi:hypothetical protein